jgi:hypothetical protein
LLLILPFGLNAASSDWVGGIAGEKDIGGVPDQNRGRGRRDDQSPADALHPASRKVVGWLIRHLSSVAGNLVPCLSRFAHKSNQDNRGFNLGQRGQYAQAPGF